MRAPRVEYTVAISRPMMPPPMTSMRFGTWRSSSAPVESTMRGSSGTKGSFTTAEPAAMIAFWKATTFLRRRAGHFDVVRAEELADALHHVDLAALAMPARPPVIFLMTPSL
jgi:hypothetical protein